MSSLNKSPPQTFARLFRPWESDNYAAAEQPAKPPEVGSRSSDSIVKTETSSFNGNMSAASSSSFSSNESDLECASSSSSSSKSSSYEESFNSSNSNQPIASSANSPTMTNHATPQIPYTSSYFYGSLEGPASHFTNRFATHLQPAANSSNVSYMLPVMTAPSNFYYAAAAAAAAANNEMPTTSSAAYALNSYAFNFMDREYARVMVEDAQLKAANARKQRPKKFKCNLCDVAFSNNGQLKGHIRIHTGERPFKCDFETCDKTFTRNEELTRHKRIHTGLKPYPCPVCGKCFGRRDHLSKHLKTHLPKTTAAMYLSMYPDFFGL